jgi:ornithine carbamoyltransferase
LSPEGPAALQILLHRINYSLFPRLFAHPFGKDFDMPRHLLRILDLEPAEARSLVNRALEMKQSGFKSRMLENKVVILLFEKASTRTRVSFEVAVIRLGGSTMFMTTQDSQLGRDEPLSDTARVLSRYADALVVRTFGQVKLDDLAHYSTIPVVNALTDQYHPCQVLSDILTIYERRKDFENLKVAWVGDGNNMANSWINAASLFPFELALACPSGYDPDPNVLAYAEQAGARVSLVRDPDVAVAGAHFVNTDVWASMGQEEESDRRRAVFSPFQLNEDLLVLADPKAKVMHCLPAHRGEEITDELIEGERSIVFDQAENRLHMQMAILEWLMG